MRRLLGFLRRMAHWLPNYKKVKDLPEEMI